MQDRWLMMGIFIMGMLFAIAAMQIGKGFFPSERSDRIAPLKPSIPPLPSGLQSEEWSSVDRLNGISQVKGNTQELNSLYQRALDEIDQCSSTQPAMILPGPPAFSSTATDFSPPPPIDSGMVPTQFNSPPIERRTCRQEELYRQIYDAWSGGRNHSLRRK